MKVMRSMPPRNLNIKVKCLIIILAGLALTACSEDKSEQAKQLTEDTATPMIESLEKVVEERTEAAVAEVKEVATTKTEKMKETVVEVAAPVLEESAPIVVLDEAEPKVEAVPVSKSIDAIEPKTHIIKAAVTQFKPLVVFANPGDTIVWQNMNGHDTTSMNGMIPEGAEKWQSAMGELFSFTIEKEGAYLYKCTPHASLGMMGAIVVGHSDNLETIKASVDTSGEAKGMVRRVIRKLEKELSEK